MHESNIESAAFPTSTHKGFEKSRPQATKIKWVNLVNLINKIMFLAQKLKARLFGLWK